MALSRLKIWIVETLTHTDLNAEFNNILNNARDLISPLTGSLDMNGFELILDADADTSITADTDDVIDIRVGGTDTFQMRATGLFVFDSSNAFMSLGITINQSTADDEILAFKSSDIAHGVTDFAETDTYGLVKKRSATGGGVLIRGFNEGTGGVQIDSVSTTDVTTKTAGSDASVFINSALKSGTNVVGHAAAANILAVADNSNARFLFTAAGLFYSVGAASIDIFGNGQWYLNDTANANSTLGVTLNQGASDNQILALKSSDVATALTSSGVVALETDDYATFQKITAAEGGLRLVSAAESGVKTGFEVQAYSGQPDTTASTSAAAGILLYHTPHDGANALADHSANALVLGVYGRVGSAARGLLFVDEDGDIFVDGSTSLTAFDAFNDAALARAMDVTLAPDQVVRSQWDEHVEYNREDLVRAGILTAPTDGGDSMVNVTQLQRLHNGAIWQLYTGLMSAKAEIARLNEVIEKCLPKP
jgi:hypothetical protein